MYYIFYRTDDSGSDPNGSHFYQDISSYSLQQGDEIQISWSLGIPNLNDNQLPVNDSNGNPMTWSAATYPDSKIKMYIYGDDDGTGTAHGTLITHGDMVNYVSAQDFFDEEYTFTRTLGLGNVGGVTTNQPNKFNKIWFVIIDVEDGQTFYIDDVDFGFSTITTDNWVLNNNVVNNNGTLIFNNGGQAAQWSNPTGVETGKLYRVTAVFSTPDGVGPQNALVTANSMGINLDDPNTAYPTLIQSGTVVTDVYFPNTTSNITIDVTGGAINIHSMTIQEVTPYGGTVECWDLNGVGDFAFLYTSQTYFGDGSVVFDEAPEDTYLHQDLINTNRALDFDSGAKCNVTFDVTNYTGSGELTFRLYNDEGEGFEHTISSNGSYSFSGIIGDDSSLILTSKFGFYVSSTNTFSGEIDNISLVLDGEGAGKTISFNEKSKGWTSFKSFVPEFGLSCVNQYYTMNLGQLWKHHVEQFDVSGKEINRNTFYGIGPIEDEDAESSITPILNMQPAVVKNFSTLNYEGSQSKVDQFLTYEVVGEQPFPIGNNLINTASSQIFLSSPNSNVAFTTPTINGISITDLHGESGQSDIIQIQSNTLDITKTYRLSFNFSVTGQSGQSHVYFGGTSINLVLSTGLSGGLFSEDFIPTNTTEYVSIFHPHLFNGFTQDVNVTLTNILLQELDFTTDENDGEYYNLQVEKGWYVSDIHTNKQEGTLNEFIEKEGKWFNYIKGKPGQVDTAAFNFQGLGMVGTIDIL